MLARLGSVVLWRPDLNDFVLVRVFRRDRLCWLLPASFSGRLAVLMMEPTQERERPDDATLGVRPRKPTAITLARRHLRRRCDHDPHPVVPPSLNSGPS
jgi:hypothetical protein